MVQKSVNCCGCAMAQIRAISFSHDFNNPGPRCISACAPSNEALLKLESNDYTACKSINCNLPRSVSRTPECTRCVKEIRKSSLCELGLEVQWEQWSVKHPA